MSAKDGDKPGGPIERLGRRLLERLGLSDDKREEAQQPQDELTSLARRLAAGAGIVTALLTVLGITGGQLDRVLRNDPLLSLIAIGLLGLGIIMGIAVSEVRRSIPTGQLVFVLLTGLAFVVLAASTVYLTLQGSNPLDRLDVLGGLVVAFVSLWVILLRVVKPRAIALAAGVLLFLAGLVVLSVVSVTSKATKERPRVTGMLARNAAGWMLEGRVSAQGLTRREHILIVVEGVDSGFPLAVNRAGREYDNKLVRPKEVSADDYHQTLMLTRVGPDSEGKIDIPIKTPISVGVYERVRIAAWLVTERYTNDVKRFEQGQAKLEESLDQIYEKWETASEADRPRFAQEWYVAKQKLDELLADKNEKLDMASRCAEEKLDRTCLVFMLPHSSTRPALTLTPSSDQNRIRLRVRASDMNPYDVVEARMMANRRRVWLARLPPTASGKVDDTVTLAVGPPTHSPTHICAVARILRRPSPKPTSQNIPKPVAVSAPAKRKPSALNNRCGVSWQPWELATAELILPDP
jgi:hypothetical protein